MHEMGEEKNIFCMLPATHSFISVVRIPGQSGPPLSLYSPEDRATTAFDTAFNHIYVSLHVTCPYFLTNFNQIWILSPDYRTCLQDHISQKSAR